LVFITQIYREARSTKQNLKTRSDVFKHVTNNFQKKFKRVYKSDIHAETSSTLPSTDSKIKI